jgi:hypothetical protein
MRGLEAGLQSLLRERLDERGMRIDAYLDLVENAFGDEFVRLRRRLADDQTPLAIRRDRDPADEDAGRGTLA